VCALPRLRTPNFYTSVRACTRDDAYMCLPTSTTEQRARERERKYTGKRGGGKTETIVGNSRTNIGRLGAAHRREWRRLERLELGARDDNHTIRTMRTGAPCALCSFLTPPAFPFLSFPSAHVASGMWRMRYEWRRETRIAFARLLRGCTVVVHCRAVRNGDYRFVSLLAQLLARFIFPFQRGEKRKKDKPCKNFS